MVGYRSPLPGGPTGSWEGHGSVYCGGSSHPCNATQAGRLLRSLISCFHVPCSPPASVEASPVPSASSARGRKRGEEGPPFLVCAVAIVSFPCFVRPTSNTIAIVGMLSTSSSLSVFLLPGPVCLLRSFLRRATGTWRHD